MRSIDFVAFSLFFAVPSDGFQPLVGPKTSATTRRMGDSRYIPNALYSGGPEEDEAGLDLDLEEMFTMFEAADKEESFDDAIKKVKVDEKDS